MRSVEVSPFNTINSRDERILAYMTVSDYRQVDPLLGNIYMEMYVKSAPMKLPNSHSRKV